MVVIMTVDPGFGGQKFRYPVLNKIKKVKEIRRRLKPEIVIQVDGGVDFGNIASVIKAGADIVVLGGKIFSSNNPLEVIQKLKNPNQLIDKAIIFDFDGIILDSEPYQHRAFNSVLDSFGKPPLTQSEFLKYVGKSTREIWNTIKQDIPHSAEDLAKIKEEHYHALITSSKLAPMPGVLKLLNELQQHGWILAIASSSPKATLIFLLKKLELYDYFSSVVSGEEVSRSKPFPDIYNLAIKILDLPKEQILAIEDSENGLNAAVGAGLKCIAVPNAYTKTQNFSNSCITKGSLNALSHSLCSDLIFNENSSSYFQSYSLARGKT